MTLPGWGQKVLLLAPLLLKRYRDACVELHKLNMITNVSAKMFPCDKSVNYFRLPLPL